MSSVRLRKVSAGFPTWVCSQGGWTTVPLALRLVLLPEGEPPPRPDGSPGEKRAAIGDGGGFGGFGGVRRQTT